MLNRASRELSNQDLAKLAPSIFSQSGAENTSSRYKHISTLEVVEGLRKEGFAPVNAFQSRTRIEGRELFTKHIIRFRQAGLQPTVGGLFPEVVLINSHDGTSAYKLMAGLYRLVCSNGMVAGKEYEALRVYHKGDVVGNVIEGTYSVIKDGQKMIEASDHMSSIQLNRDERRILAEAAHEIRFEGDADGEGFAPEKFLEARRWSERDKTDLFTLFNIAQENVIKGGVRGFRYDTEIVNGQPMQIKKRATTREVKNIDRNTALNRALWSMAEKMAELKRAA